MYYGSGTTTLAAATAPNPAFTPYTFHAYPSYPQRNQQPQPPYHTTLYPVTAHHNCPVPTSQLPVDWSQSPEAPGTSQYLVFQIV